MEEKRKYSFLVDDNLDYDFYKSIKERTEREKNSHYINYGWREKAKYKIEISTSLYFFGKPISENKIESIWQINHNQTDNSLFVEVLGKKYLKVDGQVKPLLELVDKINKTSDSLHLQLNSDKTIKNVLELDKVLQKWEKIKFEDLKLYELEDDYFKTIIKAYDNEFKTLTQSIQMNILYQIFFYPQANIKYPMESSKIIAESKKTISQLFPQQHIYYDLWYKSSIVDDKIEVFCFSEITKNWDKRNLENEYQKNYFKLLEDSFRFRFSIDSSYTHNMNGTLEKGKTYIKEQANEKLFYISEYNISLIEDETND